jgi:Phosphotransferase enzyme family
MVESHTLLPDDQLLKARLESALGGNGSVGEGFTILQRQPNAYASTFPSEIVRCRLGNGSELCLLCKYGAGQSPGTAGHRGGVAYEAAVYHHLLPSLHLSAPRYYGSHSDAESGRTWLIIEFVEHGIRASEVPAPAAALRLAARWIGRFHAANEARLATAPFPFLSTYDPDYYRQWARRTAQFARDWHLRCPWLPTLCERFADCVDALCGTKLTVIHGEYGPKNILVRDEEIYPVDWESAAVAAGEIDLASLTQKWPEEVARACEQEYQRTRWPEGPPPEFPRTLELARLYWEFRWLGDRPEWLAQPKVRARFEELRLAGERLGLIAAGCRP